MDERARLMREIQNLAFAKDEAILFLDTHPECTNAMNYYRDVIHELDMRMEEYQNKYAPIYHEGSVGDDWRWARGAWPWQNEKMEGER